MPKLSVFRNNGHNRQVVFVETIHIKDGVECDVYTFADDDSQDLAIVHVTKASKTPPQKVVQGDETIEGFMSGKGSFTLTLESGDAAVYEFPSEGIPQEFLVEHGQIMQWQAATDSDLTFYEICKPPYQDGRFENLPE